MSASRYSGLKASFDISAERYAAARPGYPAEAFEWIARGSRLPARGRILEIGCGTGQATGYFVQRGHPVLALEPGPNLARFTRRRFSGSSLLEVEESTFEEWNGNGAPFDLVLAAQSFHWLDPEVALPKVASALAPAGSLALLWNLPADETAPVGETGELTELSAALQEQYRVHAPEMAHDRLTKPLSAQVSELESLLRSRTDLFRDLCVHHFPWEERYDAERYLALLATYSGHIVLPPAQREALFAGIAGVIHAQGPLVKRYVTSLLLAAKAGSTGLLANGCF